MRFDLVDLRLFAAAADTGSITRGAEATHLALASASARIAGMEAALGVPLLERGRRGVVPTAAGRALLAHARVITAGVERMRGDLQAFSSGFRGEMRMLSNTAGLVDILPRALRGFLLAHPGIDVTIEERTSGEIARAVADGRAEFGLVAATPETAGLETWPLAVDRLTAIAARHHALAARDRIGFADLLSEPFVGLGAGALHDHLAREAGALGRRVGYRVTLGSFDAVARLVEAGVGVAVLPVAAVARHRGPGLAELRLTDAWADRRLVLCARAFTDLAAPARLLAEAIASASAA